VQFHLLGPLEVTRDGRAVAVGGPRTRAVLAMLLLDANRVVSVDRLVDELWPEHGQDRGAANLQVRLSELRRALRSAGEAERLVTRPPGYLLRVTADELDVLRFEELVSAGRKALAAGDAATAAGLLDQSLELWRGPALADVGDGGFAGAERARLEEERLAALESRIEAQLVCGRRRNDRRARNADRRTFPPRAVLVSPSACSLPVRPPGRGVARIPGPARNAHRGAGDRARSRAA
jgi:DNA-binding SARP family transcriptional activator